MLVFQLLRRVVWALGGIQVFALVGAAGTGKSFRAQLVAQKHGIDLIVDDGLLIRGQQIVAGRSAKAEKAFLAAIRTAMFHDREHMMAVRQALARERFRRILVIGTSLKMVKRIVASLELPPISRVIPIEQAASREEIARALRVRAEQGKHIIPVPSVEIKRSYPHIFFESMKELIAGTRGGLGRRPQDAHLVEKTVVRPPYSRPRKAKPAAAPPIDGADQPESGAKPPAAPPES